MVELPFDEAEAARRLGISKPTLARERLAGKIHPMRMGQRIIRYTEAILDEYRRCCPDDVDEAIAKAKSLRQSVRAEVGIYFLWMGEEVVYVGKTGNFTSRLANHLGRKEFDGYSFMPIHASKVDATEAALVDRLRPKFNIMLNADNCTARRTR